MRRLPYLNGIRAFEAAARAGSFAGAAKELNVTPAAISRMVRLLEQRLALNLFVREANRLTLTPAGRSYQAGLTQIFDALANYPKNISDPLPLYTFLPNLYRSIFSFACMRTLISPPRQGDKLHHQYPQETACNKSIYPAPITI